MHYHILATDYDGTLASDGKVPAKTVEKLKQLGSSGRILVLGLDLFLLIFCIKTNYHE